jgi:cysteine desulfurase
MAVYLDHAATTPLRAEAWAAMEPFLREHFGNPSEPHSYGREARAGLEAARRDVAEILGVEPRGVVFTSGGTEADNLALLGLAGAPPGRIVVSSIEHPAVRETARALARRGFDVDWAPVGADGIVDVSELASRVRPGDRLVAVMWANNVTGVVQPVEEIASLCAELGVPFHSDAVQAVPSLPVDVSRAGVDTAAVSAHKLGGPRGIGCLLARDPARLAPVLHGGGQEGGLRPGTENVAGAAGMAAALRAVAAGSRPRGDLRDRLETRVCEVAEPIAGSAPRLPGHSLLHVPGVRGDMLVLALDAEGFAVSAGSACASGEHEPDAVLVAQGLAASAARSAVRVTIGADTAAADGDAFAAALVAAARRLRAAAPVEVAASW